MNNTLDARISRILGQVRGIQKMVKEDRDKVELLQQVSAVKKAIDGLTKEVVALYFGEITPPEKQEEVKKVIERAIDL